MATIVTRAGKGSPLTHNEVDANFNNLNGDKLEASNNLSDLDDAATAVANLGVTASASELNILDGATLSTAELNILDGVTATTAEINQLDGNSFTGDVLPDADSTRDLGSSTKAWAEAHVDTVISTNVSDGSLAIPTTYVTNGSAKAWSGVSTASATAGDNFNISSLVDNGTGDTTHNFTSAMSNANFVAVFGARHTGTTDGHVNERTATARTVNSVRTQAMITTTGSFVDIAYAQVIIMGDLA